MEKMYLEECETGSNSMLTCPRKKRDGAPIIDKLKGLYNLSEQPL